MPEKQTKLLGEYAVRDEAAARELLENPDFVQAFSACLQLLGLSLVTGPTHEHTRAALDALCQMDIAQDWPFGEDAARVSVAALLDSVPCEEERARLKREYARLFVGPGHLEAPLWGSVYMDRDQVMYGNTWLELREWMRAHGVQATYAENDPEDNFARLLLLASQLVQERPELLCEFLGCHVLPWSGHFLDILERHAEMPWYRGIAALARITLNDAQDLLGIVPVRRRFFR